MDPSFQHAREHVVDERLLTVDLDDRNARPVPRLELGITCDVDGPQFEPQARRRRLEDRLRVVAEPAVGSPVDDDLDELAHPLTVNGRSRSLVTESTDVASTTRW